MNENNHQKDFWHWWLIEFENKILALSQFCWQYANLVYFRANSTVILILSCSWFSTQTSLHRRIKINHNLIWSFIATLKHFDTLLSILYRASYSLQRYKSVSSKSVLSVNSILLHMYLCFKNHHENWILETLGLTADIFSWSLIR